MIKRRRDGSTYCTDGMCGGCNECCRLQGVDDDPQEWDRVDPNRDGDRKLERRPRILRTTMDMDTIKVRYAGRRYTVDRATGRYRGSITGDWLTPRTGSQLQKAISDALLAAESRTIVHAEHVEEVARSDVWVTLERSAKACTEAISQALARGERGTDRPAWTLNGETTTDPDGRTLLHGAPKVAGMGTTSDPVREPQPHRSAQKLEPWQEEALSMFRRLGFSDDEITIDGAVWVDALGVWASVEPGYGAYPWFVTACNDGDQLATITDAEDWIRTRLREAHQRLSEIVGVWDD